MTARQTKALAALLTQPTKEKAAKAAGIGLTTLKTYLSDPDFLTEYEKALGGLIEDAATQARQVLSPALSCLKEIIADDGQRADIRIQACRAALEYGLRIVEAQDFERRLRALEQSGGDMIE